MIRRSPSSTRTDALFPYTTLFRSGSFLMRPEFPGELVQMGNCVSPVDCDAGWRLLTHGVGAMRKYSLGAALLDRDDPSRVLGRTSCPILAAADSDREGPVPNVAYTCGAMRVGDEPFIPFGISASAIGFPTASPDAVPRHIASQRSEERGVGK